MKTKFYANYRAADLASNNILTCNHMLSIVHDSQSYIHAGIEAYCSKCEKRHNFLLFNTNGVSTPNQLKQYKEYAERMHIEIVDNI